MHTLSLLMKVIYRFDFYWIAHWYFFLFKLLVVDCRRDVSRRRSCEVTAVRLNAQRAALGMQLPKQGIRVSVEA
jgi:hypothetical protein